MGYCGRGVSIQAEQTADILMINGVLDIPGASIGLIFTISAWLPNDLPIKLGSEEPVFVPSGARRAMRAALDFRTVCQNGAGAI